MNKIIKQKNKGFTRTPKLGVTPKGGGFTLVETLVAVSIFTMSVLTLIIILSQGITSINYAKRKIIAGYLAQEGIEYIKNIRDTNVISASTAPVGWAAFKTQTANCFSTDGCYLDDNLLFTGGSSVTVKNLPYNACPAAPSSCPQLLYDLGVNSNGRYNYSSGSPSGFTRKITASLINSDEIKVTSDVSWVQGSGTQHIIFSENLFNWIE